MTEVWRAVAELAAGQGTAQGVSFAERLGLDYVFEMGIVSTVVAAQYALHVRTGVMGASEGLGAAWATVVGSGASPVNRVADAPLGTDLQACTAFWEQLAGW